VDVALDWLLFITAAPLNEAHSSTLDFSHETIAMSSARLAQSPPECQCEWCVS
jgi:hypothetical protein